MKKIWIVVNGDSWKRDGKEWSKNNYLRLDIDDHVSISNKKPDYWFEDFGSILPATGYVIALDTILESYNEKISKIYELEKQIERMKDHAREVLYDIGEED